jgi:glycosyltransferase involved in cell wall biosynthesis
MRILVSSIGDLKRCAHNRLHEFVRYLSRSHEVTVLSIRDWWKAEQTDTSLYSQGAEDIWERVKVHYLTNRRISPILQELLSVSTVGRLMREVGSSFDVHLNYNTLISGFLVAARMRSAEVRTVYDIADDLPAMIRMSPQIPALFRPLGGALAKLMVYGNLMISEKVALTTDALDIPSVLQEKCIVLPNGVDTTLFRRQDSSALRSRLGMDDSFVLGYVGVLREWIDLEPTILAIGRLKASGHRVKLLVVGEEGGLTGPETLAQRHGVAEDVVFTGTVPYPEVPAYISCMDTGLIPFAENPIAAGAFPLKLLEYMACQVPVLSSPLPAIKSAVSDRALYASSCEEIVSATKLLVREPALVERLGTEGRQFVEERYAWDRIVSCLESVLHEIATNETSNRQE